MDRYKTEVSKIFTDENLFKTRLLVEKNWLYMLKEFNLFSFKKGFVSDPTYARYLELENETKHDVAGLIKSIEEATDDINIKRFVHFGLTSQDINDTAQTLQLLEAHTYLLSSSKKIISKLRKLTSKYKSTLCIARTHGQHAIPITIGFKFANFLHDWHHLVFRFNEASKLLKGKYSGAVGTSASLDSVGLDSVDLEKDALKELNLEPNLINTQTMTRIYLVEYLQSVVNLTCQMEKIAKEIRNLQRTEIGELYEEFKDKSQIGSSAMPQKRNPIACENICGLARIIRAQLGPLMETISLEHERDLTNSSVERIEVSTIMILTHYMMERLIKVLKTLRVNTSRCFNNLYMLNGRELSEKVLTTLIWSKNLSRTEAHEFLNRDQKTDFREQLKTYFNDDEIDDLLDHHKYLGKCYRTINAVLEKCT